MKFFIKYVLVKLVSFMLLPLYVLPLNKNKFLFISYGGRQYSCNPKYISEYLLENHHDSELVWIFREPEKFNYLPKEIKKVKYLSFWHFYHVITSKFCITNMGFNKFFLIRRGQRFIQTWHGGGAYKKCGNSLNKSFFEKLLEECHGKLISDFISSSKVFSDNVIKDFNYKGDILQIGMPRNSFLLKEKDNELIKEKLKRNIDKNYHKEKFYILYAPTWRDDGDSYELPDFKGILNVVKERFNKEAVILFRSHHFQEINSTKINDSSIDVTNYPDMQELLLVSDMLVSDYSSSIWDFSLLYKPCFLYTPDLSKYETMRGFYINIKEWGFDVCLNNSSLIEAIAKFETSFYQRRIKNMHDKFGSFECIDSCDKLLNNN